jgi:hypothetical protein
MIIYLSGPISSRLDTYKKYFHSVHSMLTDAGHTVISPHFLPLGLEREQDYLRIAHECIKAAEAIYLLKGWQNSPGAKTELKWAMDMSKVILLQNDSESDEYLYKNEC